MARLCRDKKEVKGWKQAVMENQCALPGSVVATGLWAEMGALALQILDLPASIIM